MSRLIKAEKAELENKKEILLKELKTDKSGNIVLSNPQLKELLGRNLKDIANLGEDAAAVKVGVSVDF